MKQQFLRELNQVVSLISQDYDRRLHIKQQFKEFKDIDTVFIDIIAIDERTITITRKWDFIETDMIKDDTEYRVVSLELQYINNYGTKSSLVFRFKNMKDLREFVDFIKRHFKIRKVDE